MKATRYVVFLLGVGIFLSVVGIALIIAASLSLGKCEDESVCMNCSAMEERSENQYCAPSGEAIRIRFYHTLERIREVYFTLYPNNIIWHPEVEGDEIKRFRPYNCSPQALKDRTDAARSLYNEAAKLKVSVNQTLLKPRELKSLIQLLHYLKTDFGKPYGENYYAGDWMMGPNRFCAGSICRIGYDLHYHFNFQIWSWQPKTLPDVMFVIQQLRVYRSMIEQYIGNMRYGIAAGMVRSREACEVGLYSFAERFFKVNLHGSTGILQEWFVEGMTAKAFLSNLEDGVEREWIAQNNKSVADSIKTTLVEYVGKPLNDLLQFLKYEYKLYCVPSNVSSGLATLPLDYVYYNGTRTSNKTTKKLPFGEKLDGKKAYEHILYFFTTISNLTPDAIHKLGKDKIDELYPEAVKIARNYTGQSGDEAVVTFKKMLSNQSSYFNDAPFPGNESNDIAFKKCTSLAKAKLFCPKRYEAFQKWAVFVREILSRLEPKLVNMFHYTGEKRTTPSCPVNVVPNFNPKTGSQSYVSSHADCFWPCRYRLPFFMDNLGPIYNAISVAGHEGRPGHHTQLQGNIENFGEDCEDAITWLNEQVAYPSFSEGWALYAENPLLAQGTDVYDNNPVQKYGMIKWQIWRAIRLVVDTGMHYKGMNRSEALEYHAKYAWDVTDKATKDVTRYQSGPGQATAYMIGQLAIWRLRNHTKRRLEAANIVFSERDFHYQVLSQGKSPMEYLKIHINKYIECMIGNAGNCDMLEDHSEQVNSGDQLTKRKSYKKMLPNLYRTTQEHFD